MLVSTPAFALNPLSRALKFYAFDDLCLNAARLVADEWAPEPTLIGGHFGEIELTPTGAMPTTET